LPAVSGKIPRHLLSPGIWQIYRQNIGISYFFIKVVRTAKPPSPISIIR
jgi:hypothetical protein